VSKWQWAFLILSIIFMAFTFAFGAKSDYTTGLALLLPWVIAVVLGGIAAGFVAFASEMQQRFDMALACMIVAIFDFGLMPLLWVSPYGFSLVGFLSPFTILLYTSYALDCLRTPSPLQESSDTAETNISRHLIHPCLLPYLSSGVSIGA